MTDEKTVDEDEYDSIVKQMYLGRCENEVMLNRVFSKMNYICFSIACFLLWQFIPIAFNMRTSDYRTFGIFMLVAWGIVTVCWIIYGLIASSSSKSD